MDTQQITIRVTRDAASLYETASAEERRKLDALLSLRLSEVAQASRPLLDIVNDASAEAQSTGRFLLFLSSLLTLFFRLQVVTASGQASPSASAGTSRPALGVLQNGRAPSATANSISSGDGRNRPERCRAKTSCLALRHHRPEVVLADLTELRQVNFDVFDTPARNT